MIPLNYHHLYYFYTIAKAGSIAKASETVLLAQPTLSTQLKQLEIALGRKLFERKSQRLFLTEDGRLVLDYAESIFELGQELQDTLRDRPKTGRMAVQIGVLNGTPRAFGHALLECALSFFPTAHIIMREGNPDNLREELQQQRLDLVLSDVSIWSQKQEEFSNHLVGKIPIVFAAAPLVVRRYRQLPRDLEGAPFILPSSPSQVYHQVRDFFVEKKISPRIVAEMQDIEIARRLAVAGHGIVPLNAYTVSVSKPAGALVIMGKAILNGLYESVYLVTRKRKWPNPITEKLIKTFRFPRY